MNSNVQGSKQFDLEHLHLTGHFKILQDHLFKARISDTAPEEFL